MKIIHIITGLNKGGAEKIMCDLAIENSKKGMDVYVVSLMGKGFWGEFLTSKGINLTTLDMPRGGITLKGLKNLYLLIKKIQPDVVQNWMYHANLIGGSIAKLAGVHSIFWGIHHANFDKKHNSRKTLAIIKISALLSRWIPTKIICCSVNSTHLHISSGFDSKKFASIANGYSTNAFKPNKKDRIRIHEELNIPGNRFLIGMVARYDPQKDHENLFKCIQILKKTNNNFICLLAGQGMSPENGELISSINSYGIMESIKLLGPRNDIKDVMNALDLHILSSLGEAFPNVLAEAMLCETPCLTTDVGDARLIVGSHGWVVPSKDSCALSSAVLEAFSMSHDQPEQWDKLKKQCREHIIANFSLEKMCENYSGIWMDGLGKKH